MLAVGEHLIEGIDDQTLQMMAGMGSSVALLHHEPCGALTSGVLVIGALHDRKASGEDVSQCEKLASCFRQKFSEEFGSINCQNIRGRGSLSEGKDPCSELVERATGILLQTLA